MENNTDWIQHYGFILVAFAHMTDWKLLDCELQVIQEKMEFIISKSNKEYTTEDVAQNLIQIINKYEESKQGRGKEMVTELMDVCQSLKNEPWFDDTFGRFPSKTITNHTQYPIILSITPKKGRAS